MNMRTFLIIAATFLSCTFGVRAQEISYPEVVRDLVVLQGASFKVRYSPGQEERARDMAALCEGAMVFMEAHLSFRPVVELLVLSPSEWSTYTSFPVYGMPHPVNDSVLVMAAEDNAFWSGFLPDISELPAELAQQMRDAYGTKEGTLSAQPFFDLLVLHELAHLYHGQYPVRMPRLWLYEYFANVFLHTYIAETEPQRLAALTVFPRMVVANGTEGFDFTSLAQLETYYDLIAKQHPKNYGWYQCKWHQAAADAYDREGPAVLRRLWDCFQGPESEVSDAQLVQLLRDRAGTSVAEVMTKW